MAEHPPSFQHPSVGCTQCQLLNDLCTVAKHVKPTDNTTPPFVISWIHYQSGIRQHMLPDMFRSFLAECWYSSIPEALTCFKHRKARVPCKYNLYTDFNIGACDQPQWNQINNPRCLQDFQACLSRRKLQAIWKYQVYMQLGQIFWRTDPCISSTHTKII